MASGRKRLFVIDGPGVAYQAFHAISGLSAPDGTPTGALYGFVALLRKLLREEQPDYLAVAWDPPGPVFRHQLDERYKATRKPMPDELVAQLPLLRQLLEAFRVPVLELQGYEADDVMATLARRGREEDLEVVLVTRDKDCKQLLGEGVRIYDSRSESYLDAQGLEASAGLTADQWVHLQALMGDSSDNIPGVRGIGVKTATRLLQEYGELDRIYEHLAEIEPTRTRNLLAAGREEAYRSLELVTLRQDVELPETLEDLRHTGGDEQALAALFQHLGFRRFLGEALPTAPEPEGEHTLVTGEEALRELAARCRQGSPVALLAYPAADGGLAGLSLAPAPGVACYVPLRSPALTLPLEAVQESLGPVLRDAEIPKVCLDHKATWHLLVRAGLELAGVVEDLTIGAYLLNPVSRSYDLRTMALEHLHRRIPGREEVLGKGKKATSMEALPLATACEHACREADTALQVSEPLARRLAEEGLEEVHRQLELPLVPVLGAMEARGLLLDVELLQRMSAELRAEIADLEERAQEEAGEPCNLASPRQLQHLLFEVRGLQPVKKGKTGPSTDAESLALLHAVTGDPLCGLILRHRELSKLRSTYVDALPALVDGSTGRLHTQLHQTVAATGRLSSSDPNLQNIPVRTELGRRIRQAFVAPPGSLLLSGDYSQIELRVLAHYSHDQALLRAFEEGRDVHREVAARISGVAYDEVDPDTRRRAKAVNFGVIYGQTAHGLSRELGIPRAEAQEFIDHYFATFPEVRRWIDEVIQQATRDGEVRTLAGRRRPIPELASTSRVRHALGERTAVNTIIQGSAADLIKRAMLALAARLERESRPEALLLQIHDELLLECPEAAVPEAGRVLTEELEGVEGLGIPLVVNIKSGPSWGELS